MNFEYVVIKCRKPGKNQFGIYGTNDKKKHILSQWAIDNGTNKKETLMLMEKKL